MITLLSLFSLTGSSQAAADWPFNFGKSPQPVQSRSAVAYEKTDVEVVFGARFTLPQALREIKRKMPHTIAEILDDTAILPRDTTVFNWSKPRAILDSGAAMGPKDKQITAYLRTYTTRYWKSPNQQGLYFAQDPYSSEYAGTTLLMATLRGNTRYFDQNNFENDLSPEARQEWNTEGCPYRNLSEVLTVMNKQFDHCAALSKLVAQAAQVKFLMYKYVDQELPQFCTPHLGRRALIVFDETAFVEEKTAVFDRQYPTPAAFRPQAQILAALEKNRGLALRSNLHELISLGDVASPENFQTWAKSSLFDCDWP